MSKVAPERDRKYLMANPRSISKPLYRLNFVSMVTQISSLSLSLYPTQPNPSSSFSFSLAPKPPYSSLRFLSPNSSRSPISLRRARTPSRSESSISDLPFTLLSGAIRNRWWRRICEDENEKKRTAKWIGPEVFHFGCSSFCRIWPEVVRWNWCDRSGF